jgi:hypothetical protein
MRVMLDVDADLAGDALELDSCHPHGSFTPRICRYSSRSSIPRAYQNLAPAHYKAGSAKKGKRAKTASFDRLSTPSTKLPAAL